MFHYKSGDDESDNNEDKVCSLLDDMGGSHVRSRARSRVVSHDYRFCDHGVTITFFFGMSSNKQVIIKNHSQLGKKPPNPTGKKGRKTSASLMQKTS